MALPATVIWECRASGASDNNGGGFVGGGTGTDFSQQNAAQSSGTDLAVDAVTNTKVTSATHNFVAADVDNLMQITAGVGYTTGFYRIVSVAANAATLDRSPAAVGVTGGTWAVGGALATIGKLAGAMVAQNLGWATGSFTATATSTFVGSGNGANTPTWLRGYGSTRGDTGRATLTLQTNTGLTGINSTTVGFRVEQVNVDCGALGTSTGIATSASFLTVQRCKVSNFTTRGIYANNSNDSQISDCEITGGSSAATAAIENAGQSGSITGCFLRDNQCPGVLLSNANTGSAITNNIIANNTGASSDGIRTTAVCLIYGNTIHGNGRHGILNSTAAGMANQVWLNNIFSSNGGYGISGTTTAVPAIRENDGNAFYSNTSGARNLMDSTTGVFGVNPYTNVRDVTLTASPYVGPTSGGSENFALNLVAGGGKACRQAGIPGTFTAPTTSVGYADIGAVQAQDTGGSHFIG